MSIIAAWKDKYLGVSDEFTAMFKDFKNGWEQADDITQSTDDQKTQTVQRGLKPFELSFSVDYVYPWSGNVRTCYTSWSPYIGMVDYFYLNDEWGNTGDWGPPVQLVKCELSNLEIDDFGRWLRCTTSLTFREYNADTAAIKADMDSVNAIKMGQNQKQEIKRILDLHEQGAYNGERVTFRVGSKVQVAGKRWADGALIPEGMIGMDATILEIDNSGIRFKIQLSSGEQAWINTTGVSLCE